MAAPGYTSSPWRSSIRGRTFDCSRRRRASFDVRGKPGVGSPKRTLRSVVRHRYPDTSVFYRRLTSNYPLISRGDGCYVYDSLGKRYLDACGGALVANIGHGVREIGEAMARQAARIGYVNGTSFTSEPVEALAAEIARRCSRSLDEVYFLTSGSEAVEAALKLARLYWVEAGKPTKQRIVAFAPAYHGNTLLALSVSAREHYKLYFRDWLIDAVHVPTSYSYRCACRGRAPLCPSCSGQAVTDAILTAGPDRVAAVFIEPVGGSSTGASIPAPAFLRRVREACDQFDVLLVADEVLTGVGRTGTWSALEPYRVEPDILNLGKGLCGGYAPLSAVVASTSLLDVLSEGSGGLLHAQTFSHHPVLCAAGLATLRYMETHQLIERCATIGLELQRRLATLNELPHVEDMRGRGLLAGIEFVQDKDTRDPFPRDARFAETFAEAALQMGLVVWPNTGHADGVRGDLVSVAPPFVITDNQIDELIRLFTAAMKIAIRTAIGEG